MFFGVSQYGGGTIIRAYSHTLEKWFELIPDSQLVHDLPAPLIDPFTHWMDKVTGDVEWRPRNNPWLSSDKHWVMRRSSTGDYRLQKDAEALIDMGTPTARMVSDALSPIENLQNMILHTSVSARLSIELPRFRLSFSMEGNDLHSSSHPGLCLDTNRSIGTFIGLKSLIVLKPVSASYGTHRRVIMPMGEFNVSRTEDHVSVTIETAQQARVAYQEYEIDDILMRLVGDGTLLGHLFKAFVHAITSSSLPDPFTRKTGTETAITELSSPRSLSFHTLGGAEEGVVNYIRQLAPRRTWYPKHVHVMEEVRWDKALPVLSQHDDFVPLTSAILEHARRLSIFHGNHPISPSSDDRDRTLHERAAARRATSYPADVNRSVPPAPPPRSSRSISGHPRLRARAPNRCALRAGYVEFISAPYYP